MPLGRQGGPKRAARKRFAQQRRRLKVAKLYAEGKTQAEIGAELGVHQRTAGRDVAAVSAEWQLERLSLLDKVRKRQLEHAARIRDAAWGAWERSLQEFKQTRQERTLSADVAGSPPANVGPVKAVILREDRNGDPRFLAVALDADKHEAQLLGLYELPGSGNGAGISIPMSPGDTMIVHVRNDLPFPPG